MNVPRCRSDYIQAYHNMYQRLSIIFASHICFVEMLHCKPTSFSLLSTKILFKYTSYVRGQERLEMKIPKKLSVCSLKSIFSSINQSKVTHILGPPQRGQKSRVPTWKKITRYHILGKSVYVGAKGRMRQGEPCIYSNLTPPAVIFFIDVVSGGDRSGLL